MSGNQKVEKQERLNFTLRDLRQRVDTLAKSIYLIGGGSVVLSVNLYLMRKTELKDVICTLKTSWFFLLLSILLFSVVTGCLIVQGYISTEYYRKKIEEGDNIKTQPKRLFDRLAFGFGVLGFLSFLIGLLFLIVTAFCL